MEKSEQGIPIERKPDPEKPEKEKTDIGSVINHLFPLVDRLGMRNEFLNSHYVWSSSFRKKRGIPQPEEDLIPAFDYENLYDEQRQRILKKLEGYSAVEKLSFLEKLKAQKWEPKKKFWNDFFDEYESKDRDFAESFNINSEVFQQPEKKALKALQKDYHAKMMKKLFGQRFGEWTVSRILNFLDRQIKEKKMYIPDTDVATPDKNGFVGFQSQNNTTYPESLPPKESDSSAYPTIITADTKEAHKEASSKEPDPHRSEPLPDTSWKKETSVVEHKYIEVICQNPQRAIHLLWERLNKKCIKEIPFEVFEIHFDPTKKSEGMIFWKLKPKTLVYLYYFLTDVCMFPEPITDEIEQIDTLLDHFDIPSPRGGSKDIRKQRGKLKKTLHDIKTAEETGEKRKRKSSELDLMDYIISEISQVI